MLTLYGISNCDQVRKARTWLKQHDIEYRFFNFKEDQLSKSILKTWISLTEFENIINKRSTSWRQLNDLEKSTLSDTQQSNLTNAINLVIEKPTLIKRPVLLSENKAERQIEVGFSPANYQKLLG